MDQPLGHAAGNWIELMECLDLLRGERPAASEDLRELSLLLAGWMIFLGAQAPTPKAGKKRAEDALSDGSALKIFLSMVEAQSGDCAVFENPVAFHQPGATRIIPAWKSGFVHSMDTTQLGWAVQRTGAGREKAGEAVDPHAGIDFHARCGAFIEVGQPLATLYATHEALLDEPAELLRQAIVLSEAPPPEQPLVRRILTRHEAQQLLDERQLAVNSGQ